MTLGTMQDRTRTRLAAARERLNRERQALAEYAPHVYADILAHLERRPGTLSAVGVPTAETVRGGEVRDDGLGLA